LGRAGSFFFMFPPCILAWVRKQARTKDVQTLVKGEAGLNPSRGPGGFLQAARIIQDRCDPEVPVGTTVSLTDWGEYP